MPKTGGAGAPILALIGGGGLKACRYHQIPLITLNVPSQSSVDWRVYFLRKGGKKKNWITFVSPSGGFFFPPPLSSSTTPALPNKDRNFNSKTRPQPIFLYILFHSFMYVTRHIIFKWDEKPKINNTGIPQ